MEEHPYEPLEIVISPPVAKAISPVERYLKAISVAIAQQLPILFLSSMILDGGGACRTCVIAAVAHWSLIAAFFVRRYRSPTAFDLAVIRWAYAPLVVLVPIVSALVAAVL